MSEVKAVTEQHIQAPAATVRAALADYATVRPKILTEHYRDFRVLEGGVGDGTVAAWTLQATQKRSRDVVADVDITSTGDVVERDRNSTLVTTYRVTSHSDTVSHVRVETTWKGAGGIGGFFERTFAPKGLDRIHAAVLTNLDREL
ncbi:SRPBCC family protein [Patulibacter americanus]|uniref:SRPBCC family protein n=1 Tax=Patulibacter americanus TaxID=588672 RepID=UPI0003B483D3|nr:SRPBCC family protein [Patulibacter americanus]